MEIPEGLKHVENQENSTDEALELVHSIYGLVQAARQFFKTLKNVLAKEMNFEMNKNDQCLLIKKGKEVELIICLYIDDTMIVGSAKSIELFKNEIKKCFKTKEEGEMNDYVGCMVKYDE